MNTKFRGVAWVAVAIGVLALGSNQSGAAGIYTSGHGDLQLTYEAGEFSIHYHLDNSVVSGGFVSDGIYSPADLITSIPPLPVLNRPAGATWDFTGNAAGEPLWYIQQIQQPDRPWLGISTEELSNANFSGNLQYALTSFSGPGEMALFTTGSFGTPTVHWQTSNGLSAADVISVSVNTHAHYNWTFTAPGVYTLDITASGTLSPALGGGTVSDTSTFTFWVAVPEPASTSIALIGLLGCGGLVRQRRGR